MSAKRNIHTSITALLPVTAHKFGKLHNVHDIHPWSSCKQTFNVLFQHQFPEKAGEEKQHQQKSLGSIHGNTDNRQCMCPTKHSHFSSYNASLESFPETPISIVFNHKVHCICPDFLNYVVRSTRNRKFSRLTQYKNL